MDSCILRCDQTLKKRTKFYPYLFFVSIVIVLAISVIPKTDFARMPEMRTDSLSSEWVQRDGHTLILNGRSIHKVTIFDVNVYQISLYLEKRSEDAEVILRSKERKLIRLEFLRAITADQLRTAFSNGFIENCHDQCDPLKKFLNSLNSQISDYKEGESIELQFLPNRLILSSSQGNYLEMDSPDFERIVLLIWLGKNPPSLHLKKGILGAS